MSKTISKTIFKSFSANLSTEKGERAVTATVTTSTPDRDSEIIVAQGVNSKEYELNPILLWMHSHDAPIGKCVSLTRKTDSIVCKFVFPPRPDTLPDTADWLPDEIFALYQAGVLSAFSIGFIVNESRQPTATDLAKYPEVQRVFSKVTLIEISAVTVPANSSAVVLAVSKGLLSQKRANELFKSDPETTPPQLQTFPHQTRSCLKCKAEATQDDMENWGPGYICDSCAASPATCKTCQQEKTLGDMDPDDDWDPDDWDDFDCKTCKSARPDDDDDDENDDDEDDDDENDEEKRLIINVDVRPGEPAKRLIIYDWQPRMKLNPDFVDFKAKAHIAKLRGRIQVLEDAPPRMIPIDEEGEQ